MKSIKFRVSFGGVLGEGGGGGGRAFVPPPIQNLLELGYYYCVYSRTPVAIANTKGPDGGHYDEIVIFLCALYNDIHDYLKVFRFYCTM